MPITHSEAWAEALATNKRDVVPLLTLEIFHPAFLETVGGVQVAVPVRVVRDVTRLRARIETGAPRNSGSYVDFLPMPFEIEFPRIGELGAEAPIRISNVNRRVQKYLEGAATGVIDGVPMPTAPNEPITVIFRSYLSTDPAVVAQGPYQLYLRRATAKGTTLEGGLLVADPRSKRVLNSVYDMTRFAALMDAVT